MKLKLKQIVFASLMAALVAVGTMLIQVPTPTKGYIHIGDSLVYLCGILLGPLWGGLAAGLGSMLADLLSGFGVYAPATLVIKGLDAFIAGQVYYLLVKEGTPYLQRIFAFVFAASLGGIFMIGGYLAYETLLYGFPTAVLGVSANIAQGVGGCALAAPLLHPLEKLQLSGYLKEGFNER